VSKFNDHAIVLSVGHRSIKIVYPLYPKIYTITIFSHRSIDRTPRTVPPLKTSVQSKCLELLFLSITTIFWLLLLITILIVGSIFGQFFFRISIFGQNFYFWSEVLFLVRISIFVQNLDFWSEFLCWSEFRRKFPFLNFRSWFKFRFLTNVFVCLTNVFGQHINLGQELQFWGKSKILGNRDILVKKNEI